LAIEDEILKGVVSEVGIIRDEDQFRNFNLTIGITVETDKKLSYKQGERLLRQFRKNLLGKKIEVQPIAVPCPICGKAFNSEFGTRQHMRMVHSEEEIEKAEKDLEKYLNKKK
jgi:hypothetical protein